MNIMPVLKMLCFCGGSIVYVATTIPLYPIYLWNPMGLRGFLLRNIRFWARFAMWFMQIDYEVEKDWEGDPNENFLLVSNHLSYLDVLMICSEFPSCFVTSVEIKNTPVLGLFCKLGGCVFVERRNKNNLGAEVSELVDTLKHGENIVIFPEATSTNGSNVKQFKRALFRSVFESNRRVLPVTVNYESIDGEEICLANRDRVFWYDDMTFPDHLWGVFKAKKVKVKLTFSRPVSIDEVEDHTELANKSHDIVESKFRAITE